MLFPREDTDEIRGQRRVTYAKNAEFRVLVCNRGVTIIRPIANSAFVYRSLVLDAA
jgi:hypothetical protein